MAQRINLDHYAGAPLAPEAKATMAAALEEMGNASAPHAAGRAAKLRLEQARRQVAALLNAKPAEIYFTSCGTESNNWALRGLLAGNKKKGPPSPAHGEQAVGLRRAGPHLVISAIEHPSISLIARRLELDGAARVSVLPVDRDGLVSPADLKAAITPETALVSVMLANGEVGTIEPVKELAAIAHEHGALLHTDAVAAAGQIAVDVKALGVDGLSLAADQFGGPQGAAALFIREGVRILPLLEGGGQETGGRSGTENVPALAGFGAAAEAAQRRLPQRTVRLAQLRDQLRDGLQGRIEQLRVNGSWSTRLPHNLHICIEGASSESLVLGLDQAGVAAGLGSACNAKAMRPSHVLKAMGLTDAQAGGALVLTLGDVTTEEDIGRALELIPAVVQRLRSVTALTSRS